MLTATTTSNHPPPFVQLDKTNDNCHLSSPHTYLIVFVIAYATNQIGQIFIEHSFEIPFDFFQCHFCYLLRPPTTSHFTSRKLFLLLLLHRSSTTKNANFFLILIRYVSPFPFTFEMKNETKQENTKTEFRIKSQPNEWTN